jgi:hypothetical protein
VPSRHCSGAVASAPSRRPQSLAHTPPPLSLAQRLPSQLRSHQGTRVYDVLGNAHLAHAPVCSFAVTVVDCKDPHYRISCTQGMLYPVFEEFSAPFPKQVFCLMDGVAVLAGWFAILCQWVYMRGIIIDSWCATLAGAQWHRQFFRLNITIISHACSWCCDHRKLGSGQGEPPWPGVHNQLAVYPSLVLMPITQYVSGHFSTGFCLTIGTHFIPSQTSWRLSIVGWNWVSVHLFPIHWQLLREPDLCMRSCTHSPKYPQ